MGQQKHPQGLEVSQTLDTWQYGSVLMEHLLNIILVFAD